MRQRSVPILLGPDGRTAPLQLLGQSELPTVSEADIQLLVHRHPQCLPIREIDALFAEPISVCTELSTPAGPIDNFLVTPSGLPVLVECKLWRNPEGRRQVVGQIIDYAKELTRWSSSDLQREVSRRLQIEGNALLQLVRERQPQIDEIEFNDALTANLRRGRFLLLIVGDGIREGVEAIAEYLQVHAGLHFSLGLVELPIYTLPGGARLVVPRIVARTTIISRNVVALPSGYVIEDDEDSASAKEADPERTTLQDEQQAFWAEFLKGVKLDDPEQMVPKPARQGYVALTLPAPRGSSWLTIYRDRRREELGVFLSSSRNSPGEYAMRVIADDWENVRKELNGTARLTEFEGRPRIVDSRSVGPLDRPDLRKQGFAWLTERVNSFVNVLRPRVRAAVSDYLSSSERPT